MSGPDESTAGFSTKLTVAEAPAGSSSDTKEIFSSTGAVFTFEHVPSHSFASTSKEVVDRWEKWGLSARRSMLLFRFKGSSFTASEAAAFLLDLFNDATVRGQLAITANERAAPSPLSGRVGAVQFEQLRTSVTSMTFFDRLADANVVVAVPAEGGEPAGADGDAAAADGPLYIRKQLEEVIEGVPVGDRLSDALVNPESENAGLFDESTEQRELLFRIFKHVVVGGSVCQYEDDARPYLNAARDLYKDLVTVGKDPSTGKVAVQSHAYSIKGLVAAPSPAADGAAAGAAEPAAAAGGAGAGAGAGAGRAAAAAGGTKPSSLLPLFPNSSPLNCCWVVVHPARYQVAVYYFPWVPFW